MIARTSFQLLLLANLVLAVLWIGPRFGFDLLGGGGREPERMASQLHPDQVRLIGEAVAPPAADSAPAASSTPLAVASAPASSAVASCMQWSGLAPEQVAVVNAAIRTAGEGVTLREEVLSSHSYWINIPPLGNRAAAEKRGMELRQQGVQDLFVVRDAGPDQWAISLGLYRNEAAANRFFEDLQKKGLKGARLTVRDNPSSRIQLSGPSDQLARVAQQAADALKGGEQGACGAN